MCMASVLRVASIEARFDWIEAGQSPTRAKICDGMCTAWGSKRRNLRIAPRRRQPPFREVRLVITVDQVVRHAWMIWLQVEQLLQNGPGFLAVGEGRIFVRLRRQQRERIKSRCFMVIGIFLIDLLHCVRVSLSPFLVIHL